ncbi:MULTISPECIES: hypothetical protein [unclassified Rhizobium]|uniref:hypothetical protein n=1 Tax=unclassified Rhizobium TaxID=2613769 RepID=UPI00160C8350|nr:MULTISPECIES: hypothetical protein [unclassified Rhizobium]MBB3385516.1 hypothetical protein [Rhizobium sp. BK098]MBB3617221.1 hypothetical protein [Rhizobium sp. BK609]MBB3682943.1 hypothetical protein [Rhizobium sp. BK612]
MHSVKIEDALGESLSCLHALKMAMESCEVLGGGGRDYCAFHLLADAAQGGISKALAILDRISDGDSQAVENAPVNNVDNGGKRP